MLLPGTLQPRTISVTVTPLTPTVGDSLEFTPTARGCGMGYGQAYAMRDGRNIGEDSVCQVNARATQRAWRNLLASATKIVERVPGYKNRFGERVRKGGCLVSS